MWDRTALNFSLERVVEGCLPTPEQLARHNIDRMLELAGWSVQDMSGLDFTTSRGVAVREFPLRAGFADYMLFVDRQAVGVVEAKKEGTSLGGVDTQSGKYLDGLPAHVQKVGVPLPFAYESTGVETVFRDIRDPDYRSRRAFSFHRPGTLMDRARETDTLRARLTEMPPLATAGLRGCQVEAIDGLEHSLSENRPRSLIQMATRGILKQASAERVYIQRHPRAEGRLVLYELTLVDSGLVGAMLVENDVARGPVYGDQEPGYVALATPEPQPLKFRLLVDRSVPSCFGHLRCYRALLEEHLPVMPEKITGVFVRRFL